MYREKRLISAFSWKKSYRWLSYSFTSLLVKKNLFGKNRCIIWLDRLTVMLDNGGLRRYVTSAVMSFLETLWTLCASSKTGTCDFLFRSFNFLSFNCLTYNIINRNNVHTMKHTAPSRTKLINASTKEKKYMFYLTIHWWILIDERSRLWKYNLWINKLNWYIVILASRPASYPLYCKICKTKRTVFFHRERQMMWVCFLFSTERASLLVLAESH